MAAIGGCEIRGGRPVTIGILRNIAAKGKARLTRPGPQERYDDERSDRKGKDHPMNRPLEGPFEQPHSDGAVSMEEHNRLRCRCLRRSACVRAEGVMSWRNDKGRLAPFVPIDKEMMDSPAWRATSFGARCLYMSLKRRWSFKQKNNGRIFLSQRDAQEEMGCTHRDSLSRWFHELIHYGFIVMTNGGGVPSENQIRT
jgi:hypothetical protein